MNKCLVLICVIIVTSLSCFTLYYAYKSIKKEKYRKLKNVGYHPLSFILGRKSMIRKDTIIRPRRQEPHSLKYRGHRYDRKHKRGK